MNKKTAVLITRYVGRAGIGNKLGIRRIKKAWNNLNVKQKTKERIMMKENLKKYA